MTVVDFRCRTGLVTLSPGAPREKSSPWQFAGDAGSMREKMELLGVKNVDTPLAGHIHGISFLKAKDLALQ
jgi:hypothetical protein